MCELCVRLYDDASEFVFRPFYGQLISNNPGWKVSRNLAGPDLPFSLQVKPTGLNSTLKIWTTINSDTETASQDCRHVSLPTLYP